MNNIFVKFYVTMYIRDETFFGNVFEQIYLPRERADMFELKRGHTVQVF